MRRLLLVRHASTAAVRAAAFGADEPLDERGRAAAAELPARLPRGELLVSPLRRARETAFGEFRVVPELARVRLRVLGRARALDGSSRTTCARG